jgi:hypothetical protein
MSELKQRWVPCQYCLERVKLFSVDDEFNHVVWMHQDSDDQQPYRECDSDKVLAHSIQGLNVAYPFLTT